MEKKRNKRRLPDRFKPYLPNRFSYGGSSSYPLAKGMYAEGAYFAAIIRVAGQSQSDLGNEIARKTAVWYHIGLSDTETRWKLPAVLNVLRNYECNKGAAETKTTDSKQDLIEQP
jgi:hypothetical protein